MIDGFSEKITYDETAGGDSYPVPVDLAYETFDGKYLLAAVSPPP